MLNNHLNFLEFLKNYLVRIFKNNESDKTDDDNEKVLPSSFQIEGHVYFSDKTIKGLFGCIIIKINHL